MFPICCAADLSAEYMNRFIADSIAYTRSQDAYFHMVFVDSLSKDYDEASKAPVQRGSSPNSPFKGQSAGKCYGLLQQLGENMDSGFDPEEMFVVVDERSLLDDTVLICQAVDEGESGQDGEEDDNEGGKERTGKEAAEGGYEDLVDDVLWADED